MLLVPSDSNYNVFVVYKTESIHTEQLSVLKAWVKLFLVKIDVLDILMDMFSNYKQYMLTPDIEVYLTTMNKVATLWKQVHMSIGTGNRSPRPPPNSKSMFTH